MADSLRCSDQEIEDLLNVLHACADGGSPLGSSHEPVLASGRRYGRGDRPEGARRRSCHCAALSAHAPSLR